MYRCLSLLLLLLLVLVLVLTLLLLFSGLCAVKQPALIVKQARLTTNTNIVGSHILWRASESHEPCALFKHLQEASTHFILRSYWQVFVQVITVALYSVR